MSVYTRCTLVAMENLQKTAYGSVRPYTRHLDECRNADEPNYNGCKCPKWLYIWNASTGVKTRRSLVTPSWAEAQRIAADTLRGMDPEIADARARMVKKEKKHDDVQMPVGDACDLWIERTIGKLGEDASVVNQYRWLKKKLVAFADTQGIATVQEITTLQLERWYASKEWKFAPTTRSQRWGILRSMFAFLAERGVLDKSPAAPIESAKANIDHVQGPYTDEQVDRILANVDKCVPWNLPMPKRPTWTPRLRTFILLLLHTGCDVSDAILHEPHRLERVKAKGHVVDVYRYKRIKTGVEAVIPLSPEIAAIIRDVPLEPGAIDGLPFRTVGLKLKLNQKVWSNRIKAVLKEAEVQWVTLPGLDQKGKPKRKASNTKQFRHTFAVRQLRDGQRAEEVARMLGHVDTEMVRSHYAPWVKELDTAHIERVISTRSTGRETPVVTAPVASSRRNVR